MLDNLKPKLGDGTLKNPFSIDSRPGALCTNSKAKDEAACASTCTPLGIIIKGVAGHIGLFKVAVSGHPY